MINVNIDDSESCSGKGNGNCDYNGNDMKGRNIMILVQCYVVWQGLIFEKELDLLDSAAHRYDNMLNLNMEDQNIFPFSFQARRCALNP